ncbi:MAG TPA: dihydroneopterin aldolase [Candidatus Anoxymicrobiaceae bacterium]
MKRVTIKGIEVFAYHGVLPEEQERGQVFLIDVEFGLEETMASSDDLDSTVDYAEVAARVSEISTSRTYDLIETLASEIAGYVVNLRGVTDVLVTVKKPSAPLPVKAEYVSVKVAVTNERAIDAGVGEGEPR